MKPSLENQDQQSSMQVRGPRPLEFDQANHWSMSQFDTRSELASACGFMECGGIFELFQRVGIEWNLNTIPLGPRWLYRTSKIMMIVMRTHCRTMSMCLHAPLAQTKQTALSKFNIRRAPVLGHFGSVVISLLRSAKGHRAHS